MAITEMDDAEMDDRGEDAQMTGAETAWDRLLSRLDRAVTEPAALEEWVALLSAAQTDGIADTELDPVDAARWLATLTATYAEMDDTDDRALSTLRVIVTRWLHPPRLDLAARARSIG